MKTPSGKSLPPTLQQQIKQFEEEINDLKMKLEKPHLTRSNEQDYDIKSHIIDLQNQMIELLIRQANKNAEK